MLIEVSESDILLGEKGSITRCPIARALERQTGYEAMVGRFEIELVITEHQHCMDTPIECERFIDKFDAGDSVAPFNFELPDALLDPSWHTLLQALDNADKPAPEADLVSVP